MKDIRQTRNGRPIRQDRSHGNHLSLIPKLKIPILALSEVLCLENLIDRLLHSEVNYQAYYKALLCILNHKIMKSRGALPTSHRDLPLSRLNILQKPMRFRASNEQNQIVGNNPGYNIYIFPVRAWIYGGIKESLIYEFA